MIFRIGKKRYRWNPQVLGSLLLACCTFAAFYAGMLWFICEWVMSC